MAAAAQPLASRVKRNQKYQWGPFSMKLLFVPHTEGRGAAGFDQAESPVMMR